MAHPLDQDIQAYNGMLDELCLHHAGKFALFHGGEFVEAFDSFDSAADKALSQFGEQPFLIRFVGQKNEMAMPASVAFRPTA